MDSEMEIFTPLHGRIGSFADIRRARADVRSTPRKRTSEPRTGMSAKGQEQTHARSKQRLNSITSSALIKMEFGIDSAATLLSGR